MSNLIGASQPTSNPGENDYRLLRSDWQRDSVFAESVGIPQGGFCGPWWPGGGFIGAAGPVLDSMSWGYTDPVGQGGSSMPAVQAYTGANTLDKIPIVSKMGTTPSRFALAYSDDNAAIGRLRGKGYPERMDDGLWRLSRPGGPPIYATIPTSGAVWGTAFAAVSWAVQGGTQQDMLATSATTWTCLTTGAYELWALIGFHAASLHTLSVRWQKNDVDMGQDFNAASGWDGQVLAVEPYVLLLAGDTITLTAAAESAADTVRECRLKITRLPA